MQAVSAERVTLRGAGVNLAADVIGPEDAPAILFMHGSGQTRQSWRAALALAGARGYRGVSIDLRGHGDSDWSPDGNYSLDVFVADLRAVMEQIGPSPIIVGASLGGMVGMLVAVDPPPPVGALVLVDIIPKVRADGAREVTAFMRSADGGFASLDEAADAIAAYLPHRPRPKDTSGLHKNLRQREDGRYYWHWDPAFMSMADNVEKKLGQPSPLDHVVGALKTPTLLIRGGRSRIVTEEDARAFLEAVPHAEYVDIDDAHHMVAGDANDAFNQATFDFIDRQVKQAAGSAACGFVSPGA